MKLAVFDFDSTLMDGETIDFLAQELGIKEKVAKITEEAMSGRLDFFESLTTRVGLLQGLSYQRAVDICASLPPMPGAQETIKALQKKATKWFVFQVVFELEQPLLKKNMVLMQSFQTPYTIKMGFLQGLLVGR